MRPPWVRSAGAAEGRTFTSLVAEGLRTVLERRGDPASSDPLPAFGEPDGRLLIDILDREALAAGLRCQHPGRSAFVPETTYPQGLTRDRRSL